jgi:hypothetical protein
MNLKKICKIIYSPSLSMGQKSRSNKNNHLEEKNKLTMARP